MAEELNASLSAGIDPGIIAARVANAGGAADVQDITPPPSLNLIVTGSSHMSRTIPHLVASGLRVTDLTEKSWHLNSKTLENVASRIQSAGTDALTVVVLDLFGNTSVRFRQADDTLSLAVKLPGEGGWHLLGDAVYTPDVILKEQVKLLCKLETFLKNKAKIFIPPIPRYVFGSCCGNGTHGTNINTPLHSHHALSEHTRQRHTIIKSLNNTGISNHKVINIIHCLNDTTDTPHNRISALKKHTHTDNVHLTPDGYEKIAENISTTALNMTS